MQQRPQLRPEALKPQPCVALPAVAGLLLPAVVLLPRSEYFLPEPPEGVALRVACVPPLRYAAVKVHLPVVLRPCQPLEELLGTASVTALPWFVHLVLVTVRCRALAGLDAPQPLLVRVVVMHLPVRTACSPVALRLVAALRQKPAPLPRPPVVRPLPRPLPALVPLFPGGEVGPCRVLK